MVLQPPLAALALGLAALAVACGPGPGPNASAPPVDERSTSPAEPVHDVTPAGDEGGSSTPEPRPADEEELRIDGVLLRLQPTGCRLTAAFLDQELEHHFAPFPGACHFSPDRDGQPWVVATDHGKAVLVESSVPTEAGDCDTALQLLVITERGPQLSREIQRITACGPGPWDEMMVHVLASDRVGLAP